MFGFEILDDGKNRGRCEGLHMHSVTKISHKILCIVNIVRYKRLCRPMATCKQLPPRELIHSLHSDVSLCMYVLFHFTLQYFDQQHTTHKDALCSDALYMDISTTTADNPTSAVLQEILSRNFVENQSHPRRIQ
jgi:hypothetical protein